MKFFIGLMTTVTTLASLLGISYVIYMWQTVGMPSEEKFADVVVAHVALFTLLCVTLSFWVIAARED